MRKLLLCSIAATAISFAAAAGANTPKDLIAHGTHQNISDNALGEPVTERAAYIEEYLSGEAGAQATTEEFGLGGLTIIRRAYATKINKPIWSFAGALELQETLSDVFKHGILSDDVFSGDLNRIINQRFTSLSVDEQARADLKLSLIWMRLAQAMSGDLSDERGMSLRKGSPVIRYNLPTALLSSAQGITENEILRMAPEAPQYDKLKSALADYRQIRRNGGWLAIRKGKTVEVGEKSKRIPKLRQRLKAEGYNVPAIAKDANPKVYDTGLESALKLFQTRHGLEDDGIFGGNTLKALNESVESKIDRIAESMYRWRAQGELGERYIWANLPSYTAEGWNEGQMEIRQRTIVGKKRFATPEFSDEVEYLVANPKWFLPISIVRRQKVPKLKKDPSYAERFGYKIFDRETGEAVSAIDVDWTEKGVSRQYRFVQEAGDGNALGAMKIIFPNQYSVYLHGTPGKHLFDRAQRSFSSGCVRLENPVAMAKWIARHDEEAQVSEITNAMITEENTRLELEENLPVHITYFTVTVDDAGHPNFWRDIYKRVDGGVRYVKRYERKKDKAKLVSLTGPVPNKMGTNVRVAR